MSFSDIGFHPEGSTDPTYASGPVNQSVDERQLLQALNDRKATLLLPAIFITVLLMIVGLVGNPLALYIYGWRWKASNTKIFLTCLAVVDMVNCLITIPTEIIILRNFYHFESDGLCKVSRFTTYVINNATVVVFMAIAVDRYIRICHPHRKPMSLRGAKIACGVGMGVGLLVGWPALILYGKIEFKIPVSFNPPISVTGALCHVHNDMQGYTLAFFAYLCSAFFICALILIVFYTLIGRTILQRKRRQRMRKQATAAALENLGGGVDTSYHQDSPRQRHHQHTNGNSCPAAQHNKSNPQKPTTADNKFEKLLDFEKLSVKQTASQKPAASENQTSQKPTCLHQKFLTPPPSPNETSETPTTSQNEETQITTEPMTTTPPADRATPDGENTRGCNVNNFSFRKCKKLRPPKATLMLFLITVVYIVSFLPFLIISIIRQHRGDAFYPSLTTTEQIFVNIFLRSYLVNNCSNPVVYGLCNSQFRNECKNLYRKMFRRTDGPSSSDSLRSRTQCETPRQERRLETLRQERRVESPGQGRRLERQAFEVTKFTGTR